MTAVRGTSVDITTEDRTADAYLVRPDDGPLGVTGYRTLPSAPPFRVEV